MRPLRTRQGRRAAGRGCRGTRWVVSVIAGSLLAMGLDGHQVSAAQELEPGAYAVAPVGVNVFILSNTFNVGDVAFDPAAPFDDGRSEINTTVLGYGRTLNVWGRSAQASLAVPLTAGHVEATVLGTPAAVTRIGIADPRLRFAVNLYGAPAMDLQTFASTRPKRLVGASLTIGAPLGSYSSEQLVNLGTRRWAFKPEVGLSQIFGRWIVDTFAGVWLFTTNNHFYGGTSRSQAPIASLQFHVHYAVTRRLIVSGNANFYEGGRTTIDGRENVDLQRNSRVGATLVRPLTGGRTLRVAFSRGARTTVGADFTSVSFAFQKSWGAGL
jgi:hypothetical protein